METKYAYLITAARGRRTYKFEQYHANDAAATEVSGRMLDRDGITLIDARRLTCGECDQRGIPYSVLGEK